MVNSYSAQERCEADHARGPQASRRPCVPAGNPRNYQRRSGFPEEGQALTGSVPPQKIRRWREIFLALAALAALGPGAACAPQPAATPPPEGAAPRGEAADVLARAIRFVTVNPPGDEAPLARFFVERLRAAGVEAEVIATPAGESRVGRAAAWGRLRGRGRRPAIVLLSHLDVVPAEPQEWSVDPFGGEQVDGYVLGRGAIDAKGIAVVHLVAMAQLARAGVTLDRDVIFLSVPDEELGGERGAGYLVRERRDLLRDAAYLLTEGGGVLIRDPETPAVWGITVTEKSPCWLRLESRGTPGHSSVPRREAAVPRLITALDRVQQQETPVRVVPAAAAMFAALAPLAPEEDRAGFANLAAGLENDPAFRARFLSNLQYSALVRNTVTPTVLEGSSRTNVVPAVAAAHLDARLLPGESCQHFSDQLRTVLADPGIAITPILQFTSQGSSPDSPLFRAIARVAGRSDPGAVVVPRMIAGFTDAHYFRTLGITAYGFVPRWHNLDELRGVHGPDERVSVENLERGVATLIAILKELDGVEAAEAVGPR